VEISNFIRIESFNPLLIGGLALDSWQNHFLYLFYDVLSELSMPCNIIEVVA